MKKRLVTITDEQQDFLKKHYINFPQFVRDKLSELMNEKRKEEKVLTSRRKKNGHI